MNSSILLILIISSGFSFDMHGYVEIVTGVKQHLRLGCVYTLHSPEYGLQSILRHVKESEQFSTSQTSMAALSVSKILHVFETIQCRHNRPMFVIRLLETLALSVLRELLVNVRCSEAVWLLFVDNQTTIENIFSDIYIPFDCHFMVVQPENHEVLTLTEVYFVSPKHALKKFSYGNWSSNTGLLLSTLGFYTRRNILKELVLKTGTTNEKLKKIKKERKMKMTLRSGYFEDIWKTLEEVLMFESEYHTSRDNSFGTETGNGTWNGLMGMVIKNEIDIINAGMVWDTPRSYLVDFLMPLVRTRTYMFVRIADNTDLTWNSLLLPLSSDLWIAVVVTMTLFCASLYVTEKLWCHSTKGDNANTTIFSLGEAVLFSIGAFCFTGQNKTPVILSSRIVHLTTYLSAVIVFTCYSASLTSHIMTNVYGLPFDNFRDFLSDGSYQLGVLANSAHLTYFKTSNNSIMKAIYHNHIAPAEKSLPRTMLEGLERVCTGKKFAFMSYYVTSMFSLESLNCTIQLVPNAFVEVTKSLVVHRRSQYAGIMKHTLLNLGRSGVLRGLIKKNYIDAPPENEFSSVTVNQVTPIFAVFSLGVILSLVLLILEKVAVRFHK